MSWDQIKGCINALPDSLEVVFDDQHNGWVKSTDLQNLKFPVENFQNLWVQLKSASVSKEFLAYLKKELSGLNDEVLKRLSQEASELNKRLSVKMNEVQLQVDSPASLSKLLSKVFDQAADEAETLDDSPGKHHLSVKVYIPEFNTPPSDSDDLQEKLSQLFIKSLPALRYQRDETLTDFSTQIARPLPIIEKLWETLFDDDVSDAQVLVALAIVVKGYPKQWREAGFFWDAWLAVTLQLGSLPEAGNLLFPCVWIKQIFEVERYLKSPDNVKLVVLGMDPVSDTERYGREMLCKATGVAFHGIGSDNASIRGMKDHYKLDCSDDNPIKYCKDGLLLVNMVRCIGENDDSLTNNSCYGAWIGYTLKMIHYFSSPERNKSVFVLSASWSGLTKLYIPKVCEGQYVQAPHPSVEPKSPDRYEEERKIVCEQLSKF